MTNRFIFVLFILVAIISACNKSPLYQSVEIGLNENWEFRRVGENNWMSAKVPGNVINDLLINDKIDDPNYRDNEKKLQWIENEDWEYRTTFDVPLDIMNNDQVLLHFAGLDTYADIFLNDTLVLETDNMFRSWDLPCKGKLKERNNTLRIYFHSSVKTGMQKLKQLPYILPVAAEQASENERTSPFTRKAQFQFGCDWGPRLVSCGIWRPVSLCAWSKARITDVYLDPQKITNNIADYNAVVNIEAIVPGNYNVTFLIDDKPIGNPFSVMLNKGKNAEVFNFQISQPSLWWCNGMGSHYLYTLKIRLSRQDKDIAETVQHFGVRKLELVQDSDAYGRSFYFKLNGVPVFMKGANFVPPDAQNLQVNSAAYEKLILDATSANMNMIRVSGSGVYESDTLYDLCDRNGILVWQDFMFSGAMQPGDKHHMENIRQEAIENVKRLRNHPCLALWCGNNENLLAWEKWGWKNQFSKDASSKIWSDYESLFHKVFHKVIENYDPKTQYWSSSPSSFLNKLPDKKSGDDHDWRVWSDLTPFTSYNERPGRFVSAFGMQSFPGMRTIHTFACDTDLESRSIIMDYRQRCNMSGINPTMNGNQLIMNYIQMYYNDPVDFESFVYLSQVMQAEALKAGIEAHRVNRPRCMGSLYWQLNDCWPTISWSTIDYYGRWKPSHYAVKKAFANVLVVPKLTSGNLRIYAVNDSIKPLEGELHLSIVDFNGKKIWNKVDTVHLGSDTAQLLWKGRADAICPRSLNFKTYLLVQLKVNSKVIAENVLYFTDPKFLDLPMPDISYQVKGKANQYELIMVTDKIAKNVVLDSYDKDSHFSDNNFDLLPGMEKRVTVNYSGSREELLNDLKIYTLVNSY